MKTAGSAIYANRHYLELYREKHPEKLCSVTNIGDSKCICNIIPDVYIHPTATIHPSAVVIHNYMRKINVIIFTLIAWSERECW